MSFEFEIAVIIFLIVMMIFLLSMVYSLDGICRGIWYIINEEK